MRLLKTASGKQSIRISKWEWKVRGMLYGWLPTIGSKMREAQNAFIKTAATGENIDIENSIRNSVNIDYGHAFILRDNDTIANENMAKEAIINAFMGLTKKDANFSDKIQAYIRAGRKFTLGAFYSLDGSKKYLIPTFDNQGISNLKSEFTALLGMAIDLPPQGHSVNMNEIDLKGVSLVDDIVQMINSAGYIVGKGKMEIGSIGSRKTNWDTAYNLHVEGLPAPILQKALTWFTDISNQDIRNIDVSKQKQSFDLTQRKEVQDLMERLGLGSLFSQNIIEVKEFEETKGLKRKHKKLGYIPDYQKNTLIKNISLSSFKDSVLTAIIKKVTSNPNYMALLSQQGVKDVETMIDVAFTDGFTGDLYSTRQANELLQIASEPQRLRKLEPADV